MKRIKNSVFVLLILVSSVIFAQSKNNIKQEEKIEKLKKELNLSAEQVQQIKKIHAKYEPKRVEIKEKMKPLKVEMKKLKEKKKEINKIEKKEIKAILTLEQQTKLEELKKKKKENMKKGK